MEKSILFLRSLGMVWVQALHPVAMRGNNELEKCLGKTPLQVCWFNSPYL